MPLKTFERLSNEKRQLFLKEALREFAEHGYNEASITRLVENLGIAKGSVYQYFSDKFDLYNYLIEQSYKKLIKIRQFIDRRNFVEISTWFLNRTAAEIKFAQEFPYDFSLINRIKRDRRNLFSGVWQNEELEKFNNLLARNYEEGEALSFVAYAVKEKFVEDNSKVNLEECLNNLQKIASVIFK